MGELTIQATMRGALVRLRPMAREDLVRTQAWRNDPAVRDMILGFPAPVTREMDERWLNGVLEHHDHSRHVFGVEALEGTQLVGVVQLTDLDWIARAAQLGIYLGGGEPRGRGMGREAVTLLLEHAFSVLNLRRVWVRVAGYNERALRLFEGCGFTREGCLRQHIYRQGRYADLVFLARFRDPAEAGTVAGNGVPS